MRQATEDDKIIAVFFFLFNRLSFRVALGSQQTWTEGAEIQGIAFPIVNIPQQNGIFVTIKELMLTYCYHPKFTFGAVHPMSLDKFPITCIYH